MNSDLENRVQKPSKWITAVRWIAYTGTVIGTVNMVAGWALKNPDMYDAGYKVFASSMPLGVGIDVGEYQGRRTSNK